MCENVKATLEILKQKKSNLTKGEIVVVFQQVVNDLNKQGERMKNLEQNVEEMKLELSNVKTDVQKILLVVEDLKKLREHGLLYKILLGENAKYFYITVMVALVVLAALFGVPASEFKGLLPTIGG